MKKRIFLLAILFMALNFSGTGSALATTFPPITEEMASCSHWCVAKHYDPDSFGRDQFVFVRFNNPQNMWSYEYMHGGDPSGHIVIALTAEGEVDEAWWNNDTGYWGSLSGRIGLIVARGAWGENIRCNFSSIPYVGNNQANWANGDLPAYSDMDMTALTTQGQSISLSTDPPEVITLVPFSITSPPLTEAQKQNQFYCVQKTQNNTYVFTRFLDTPVSKAYSNFSLTLEAATSADVRQQVWSPVTNSWGAELTWQSVWVAGHNFYDNVACNFDSIIWSQAGGSFNNSMYADISGPLIDGQYISLPTISNSPQSFPLSVTRDPEGGGGVASLTDGQNSGCGTAGNICCGMSGYGNSCQVFFAKDSTITLGAYPNSGYVFDCWQENGACIGYSNTLSVAMNAERNITAQFVHTEGVSVSLDSAKGSVVSSEQTPFIHCNDQWDSVCSHDYPWQENITLTATPKTGYAFLGWTLDQMLISTNPTLNVAVDEPLILIAAFGYRTFRNAVGNFQKQIGDNGGWCTDYVNYETGINFSGNAYQWWQEAINNGYQVGSTPNYGAIIVYDQGSLGYGHVGIVVGYDETTVTIRESNWCDPYCFKVGEHTENRNRSDILGYIYSNTP